MRWLYLLLIFVPFSVQDQYRVDCSPDPGKGLFTNQELKCIDRKCDWDSTPRGNPQNFPECVRPRKSAYTVASQIGNTTHLKFNSLKNSFDDGFPAVDVVSSHSGATLLVNIAAPNHFVTYYSIIIFMFQPPVSLPRAATTSSETLSLQSTVVPGTNEYAFKVIRDSTGTALWDTTIGAFFYAPQFLEIATYLPSAHVFGLGEQISTKLKHDTSVYTDFPMLSTPRTPDLKKPNLNLFGVHPFYICVENDGKAHGVLIFNSNAQEVVVGPILTYRSTGGIFDMAFFPGPKPEDVIQQYLTHIGKPYLPAYWAFGYQYGRSGYQGVDPLRASVNRFLYNQIPIDVVQLNYEYESEFETFTLGKAWSDLPSYVSTLHSYGMKVVVEVDPVVAATSHAFQRAKDSDATFVVWPTSTKPPKLNDKYPLTKDTNIMLGGSVLPTPAVFLDFLDPLGKTAAWWSNEFTNFRTTLSFDGISLNRNEPLNTGKELDCPTKNSLDYPPYGLMIYPENGCLCEDTICMEGQTSRTFHNFYDTRNLYGWSQSQATQQAQQQATQKRGSLLSRSTFVSSGRYTGHWLDGKGATWDDLKTAVTGVMQFNWFGIPFVGSDVCGSRGKPTEELCLRWHQLAAFHPLTRSNHDASEDVDPGSWDSVAKAAKIAMLFKYRYMPFMYSLQYAASRFGGTVVRPLFFEYPSDLQALSVDYQFLWGRALMISPAVDQGVTTVRTYFPSDTWYSMSPEAYGTQMSSVYFQDVPARLDSLTPVFVRGGFILPRQTPNTTLTASRANPLEVLIAVKTGVTSVGELYWDRGDDIVTDIESHKRHHWNFFFNTTSTQARFGGSCEKCDTTLPIPSFDVIEVFGYAYQPDFNSFNLNGNKKNINVQASSYSGVTHRLIVSTSSLIPLQSGQTFSLTWSHR